MRNIFKPKIAAPNEVHNFGSRIEQLSLRQKIGYAIGAAAIAEAAFAIPVVVIGVEGYQAECSVQSNTGFMAPIADGMGTALNHTFLAPALAGTETSIYVVANGHPEPACVDTSPSDINSILEGGSMHTSIPNQQLAHQSIQNQLS